jgi:heme-degrading monooxygenase HmoA/GNAT superfamily N-acetyltransferase
VVLEHALLPVRPGRAAEFEAAFEQARAVIAAAPGLRSLQLSRCLERPDVYLLLVEWERLEDHTEGFRGSAAYEEWRRLLHRFYEPFPVVEHFSEVLTAAPSAPGSPPTGEFLVGAADPELDARLSRELGRHNVAASGVGDQRELTVQVHDAVGLVGGLSGWTWGTCAGVGMFWIREDCRSAGWGGRLLAAAEAEAVGRGCRQMVLSSFTFQAPDFYRRHGYVETGRTEGLPLAGMADVHFRKDLAG